MMRTKSGIVLALLACVVAGVPSRAAAQRSSPNYSTYNDGMYGGDGYVYGWSSVEDDVPQGCDHSNYYTTTYLTSPAGRYASFESGGTSSNAVLEFDGENGYWDVGTEGYLFCSCAGANLEYSGESPLPLDVDVPTPTIASPHNWNTQSGTPPGCSAAPYYWYVRDYQVQDQQTPPQPISRTMSLSEQFSNENPSPNCFKVALGQTIQGGSTQPNGTFRDNVYLCGSSVCNSNGTCTYTRNQTWTADASTLSPVFLMTYTCSNASVR